MPLIDVETPLGDFLWLRRTRQLWKFVVFLCGAAAFLGHFLYNLFYGRVFHGPVHFLLLTSFLAWFLLSLRCPVCKTRVYWQLYKKDAFINPWTALEHIKVCPHCGDDGIKPGDRY